MWVQYVKYYVNCTTHLDSLCNTSRPNCYESKRVAEETFSVLQCCKNGKKMLCVIECLEYKSQNAQNTDSYFVLRLKDPLTSVTLKLFYTI